MTPHDRPHAETTSPDTSRPQATPEPPQWFVDALAATPEHGTVRVDGATIAYRAWGRPGARPVVLVHGGAAHSGWWDHLAPQIADFPTPGARRVVAPDLSGHGDSDWRATYALDMWATEILAAAEAGGAGDRPVVVGHSLGGIVTMTASQRRPEIVDDIVIVDSEMFDAKHFAEARADRTRSPISRTNRHYPTLDAALRRFRLLPDHPALDYIRDHVAAGSVVRDEAGWRWKFDRDFANSLVAEPPAAHPDARMTVIRAEHGRLTASSAERLRGDRPGPTELVTISDAGHHVMLDHPLELLAVIEKALAASE